MNKEAVALARLQLDGHHGPAVVTIARALLDAEQRAWINDRMDDIRVMSEKWERCKLATADFAAAFPDWNEEANNEI